MTNDELIETLMARAGRLEAALYVAKAYIKDLEAHEGAEGFSTSTHELHALYCAALKEVNQTNVQATPEKWVCEICDKTTFKYLTAPNPFLADGKIFGCPHCKSVNSLEQACQHEGCGRPQDAGYLNESSGEYVWFCDRHSPRGGTTMKTISALKLIKAIRKDKSWVAHEVVHSATESIRVSIEEWYAEKSRADRLEVERDALKARVQRLEAERDELIAVLADCPIPQVAAEARAVIARLKGGDHD